MKILLLFYVIVSFVAGVDGWSRAGWFVGVAGIAAPMLSWFGGSGLRGSFYGRTRDKIFGVAMALVFWGIADWLIGATNYRVGLFGVSIGGGLWNILGAVLGFLATSRKDTLHREPPASPGPHDGTAP